MPGKTVSAIMMFLLVLGTLALAFDVQPVKSDYAWTETIYINADGSIQPSTAPISSVDNVTYILTDNITGILPASSSAIIIQRDNIIIDGAGYTVQDAQTSGSIGIELTGRSNVTIQNMNITAFYYGILLNSSSNNSVSGNSITANNGYGIELNFSSSYNSITGNDITGNGGGIDLISSDYNSIAGNTLTYDRHYGIALISSSYCSITGNTITAQNFGIELDFSSNYNSIAGNTITRTQPFWGIGGAHGSSSYNSITGNTITGSAPGIVLYNFNNCTVSGNNIIANYAYGMDVEYSNNNSISENNISANRGDGVRLVFSANNRVSGNNLTANTNFGINIDSSSSNSIYHNNFINNTVQANVTTASNTWDSGYPSGGNCWSDYNGLDQKCGSSQDHPGSDGIGDTPYVIDSNNKDDYPLMNPWTPPAGHDVAVVSVVSSKTVIGQGFSGNITVYAANKGEYSETFNVTVYATIFIVQQNVTLQIASQNVTLESGNYANITFVLNTTGYPYGNYTISAYAWPVPGETDTADNNFTGGWVIVAIVGDITGPIAGVPDGKVDIRDIHLVAVNFGKTVPPGPSNCDITGPTPGVPDGKIDIRDLSLVARHFGDHYP